VEQAETHLRVVVQIEEEEEEYEQHIQKHVTSTHNTT
jgi:hypothetical protein